MRTWTATARLCVDRRHRVRRDVAAPVRQGCRIRPRRRRAKTADKTLQTSRRTIYGDVVHPLWPAGQDSPPDAPGSPPRPPTDTDGRRTARKAGAPCRVLERTAAASSTDGPRPRRRSASGHVSEQRLQDPPTGTRHDRARTTSSRGMPADARERPLPPSASPGCRCRPRHVRSAHAPSTTFLRVASVVAERRTTFGQTKQ